MSTNNLVVLGIFAGCSPAAVESESLGDSDDGAGATVAPPNTTFELDLGSVVVGGIIQASVNIFEPGPDGCSIPNGIGLAGEDAGGRVAVSIPYSTTSPAGSYRLDGTSVVEGMDASGDAVSYVPDMTLEVGSVPYFERSGVVGIELSEALDEATVTFTEVELESLARDVLVVSGTVTVPLGILCFPIDDVDECGWIPELPPYTSNFCATSTLDYPSSVKQ